VIDEKTYNILMEVNTIDQKKVLIIVSVMAMIAVMSSIAISALAQEEEENPMMPKFNRWGFRARHEGKRNGRLEVSVEYEENVITIAESDPEVQSYLADGYNYKGVKPLIKSIIDADGGVTTKATNAVYILQTEDGTGHIAVLVDLDAESVTKIEVVTRTVTDRT
jgi:hypothetical protein